MSKYALKLEQLVQTNAYGDILITIQYDGQGPKLVTVNGEALNAEIKHTLDTILGLVNFALAKEIPPQEIGDQLEAEPQDGVHLPINDILLVVSGALKEAPEGISKIGPDLLMQIAPEMIKEFTQGVPSDFEPTMPSQPKPQENRQPAPKPQMPEPKPQQNQNSQPQPKPQENRQPAPKPEQQNHNQSQSKEQNHERGGFFGGFNR
jgi:outer membrane biosynthesis protein TonB